jgi:hypothetical protein
MAFGYYSPITVNSAQVPSSQTDFPMLFNTVDNRLRTVGNGGHVQNANGYDIRPYTDSGLTTAITGYELERYNASTGEVVMWVKRSSITTGTVTYLAYGDSGISTDDSSSTTWSSSYFSVQHFRDGTTLSLVDSVTTSRNLINNNTVTAGTGQIDGAASFANASSQYLEIGTGPSASAITVSGWVNATSLPNTYNSMLGQGGSNTNYTVVNVKSNGKLRMQVPCNVFLNYDGTGSHTLSTGTWYYLTLTYDSTNGLIGYVNAASDNTVAANGNFTGSGIVYFVGANRLFTPANFWDGLIDEVHFATTARSADWITTEYNNQNAPGTFYTFGAEVSLGGGSTGNFFTLF